MASQQQIDANRQNAQKSTGPKTPQGKATVSRNAMTHGLTALNACINGEDMDEFDATRQSFENELKPVGPVQSLLVQQIVMAAWRLGRLRLIEGGLFQLRSIDDAKNIERDYQNLPARTRLAYLFLRDVRGPNALTILGRYESRVERIFYRALKELQRLQAVGPSAPVAPAPASENDSAKQSQSTPDSALNPAGDKGQRRPDPMSQNLDAAGDCLQVPPLPVLAREILVRFPGVRDSKRHRIPFDPLAHAQSNVA